MNRFPAPIEPRPVAVTAALLVAVTVGCQQPATYSPKSVGPTQKDESRIVYYDPSLRDSLRVKEQGEQKLAGGLKEARVTFVNNADKTLNMWVLAEFKDGSGRRTEAPSNWQRLRVLPHQPFPYSVNSLNERATTYTIHVRKDKGRMPPPLPGGGPAPPAVRRTTEPDRVVVKPPKPQAERVRPVEPELSAPSPEPGPRPTGPPEKGRSWAVLVGVNKYLSVPQLRYCSADARLLRDTLVRRCGFSPDRILLLTDEEQDVTRTPIRANLFSKIPGWLKLAGPDDRMIVFFSGHGFLDDKKRMYLAPLDCDRKNLPLTGLSVAQLRTDLDNCRARVKLLVLDTCHSGASKGADKAIGVTAAKLTQAFDKAEGLVTLASCKADEVSHEWPEKQHGVFTYWLALGLQGEADRAAQGNRDGSVTLDELYAYVYGKVTTWSMKTKGRMQTPRRLSGEGMSGIVVLTRVAPR